MDRREPGEGGNLAPLSVKRVEGACGENSAFRRSFVARSLLSVSVYELRYFETWNLVNILESPLICLRYIIHF